MLEKIKTNKNAQLGICIALMLLISFALHFLIVPEPSKKVSTIEEVSVDTFIPKGFVLIPIEILNKDAVTGLLNGKGIVDLYAPNKKKIAKSVRLIQAPQNEKVFAVLVRDNEALPILQFTQGLYVVIQGSAAAQGNSEVFQENSAPKVHINYGDKI